MEVVRFSGEVAPLKGSWVGEGGDTHREALGRTYTDIDAVHTCGERMTEIVIVTTPKSSLKEVRQKTKMLICTKCNQRGIVVSSGKTFKSVQRRITEFLVGKDRE
jgi:hypothetical protein